MQDLATNHRVLSETPRRTLDLRDRTPMNEHGRVAAVPLTIQTNGSAMQDVASVYACRPHWRLRVAPQGRQHPPTQPPTPPVRTRLPMGLRVEDLLSTMLGKLRTFLQHWPQTAPLLGTAPS